MNNDLLRWLLDVQTIPKGEQSLRLAWEHNWQPWVWALLVLATCAFAASCTMSPSARLSGQLSVPSRATHDS